MTPDVPTVLADCAGKLRRDIVPQLGGFHAGNVAMIAAMLDMVAEDWDRAPARLIRENRRLCALLAQGASEHNGVSGAADDDGDLSLSALSRTNERLRGELVHLQVALEARDDAAAQQMDAEIWNLLRDGVEARRVGSANF